MTAIELAGLGKRYFQLQEEASLATTFLPFLRATRTERWALRDISFEVGEGETVGVIGRNGAGKTTLLRLLACVTRPTEGRLTVRGRVAPLIGVGVGFHPEMTGRENVYVNGMLLGLSRRQITARLDEIVEFSEIADYIDTPVKFYSSGMYMRLGFSVAISVDPEVLLVDEVLAVGDVAFQLKCFDRMREIQKQGTSILLVSHSMHAIRLLCPRALLIRKGRLEIDGPSEDVIARHHQLMTDGAEDGEGGGVASIVNRELIGTEGPTHNPAAEESLVYRATIRFHQEVDTPQVFFQVRSEDGTLAYSIQTRLDRSGTVYRPGSEALIEVPFEARLGGGTYRLCLAVTDRLGRAALALDPSDFMIYVDPTPGIGGLADLRAALHIDGEHLSEFGSLALVPTAISAERVQAAR